MNYFLLDCFIYSTIVNCVLSGNLHGPKEYVTDTYTMSKPLWHLPKPHLPPKVDVKFVEYSWSKTSEDSIKKCPQLYEEKDDYCVKNVYVDATVKCQKHFELVGNISCVRVYAEQKPIPSCPADYELETDGRHCEFIEEMTLQFTCPAKYYVQDDSCVQEITAPLEYRCYSGAVVVGTQCHSYTLTKSDFACPDGFHKTMMSSNNNSTKKSDYGVALAAALECEKDQVIFESSTTTSCSAGYKFDKNSKSCAKSNTLKSYAEPTCPKGAILENLNCKTATVQPAEILCPPGFKKENEKCVKIKRLPVTQHCINDSFVPVGDHCERLNLLPVEYLCSEGYAMHGDLNQPWGPATATCVKEEYSAPIYECPKGFSPVSTVQCVKQVKAQMKPVCGTPGYHWNGTKCVLWEVDAYPVNHKESPDSFSQSYAINPDGRGSKLLQGLAG
eukprot:GHVL01010366.1.p1 GENE.GHVL01010366.1~~GHVL01010366.1.p1  ORF type:complete len:444 (+),score=44.87 GHVL01010366.1:33-1364(+)